jgi:hypothetical protein
MLVCKELGLANGTACAWAIEWLGLDSGNAIHVADSALQPAADQQEEATPGGEDTARVAKVAAIVNECADPAGTPADIYLRNRSITAVAQAGDRRDKLGDVHDDIIRQALVNEATRRYGQREVA